MVSVKMKEVGVKSKQEAVEKAQNSRIDHFTHELVVLIDELGTVCTRS